ncbi:MAG: hypothetical protein KME49_01760 [Brasilonema octagenarum HA4186-MV1]|jgi:hypothetical protein|nr:hypothetical protein [Brasilonema octagenarum HA4186-MV1]
MVSASTNVFLLTQQGDERGKEGENKRLFAAFGELWQSCFDGISSSTWKRYLKRVLA